MLTPANVTDRAGAIDMVRYYCSETDNLDLVQKVLVDGGYSGDNFANAIKAELPNAKVELLSVMNYIPLSCFQSAGLWSVLLDGSINAVGSGKTVSVYCRTLFK